MIKYSKKYKHSKRPFRRRREGKTNYRYRLKLLKSDLPRAVVRTSLRNTTVQLIEFEFVGDKILASATSKELNKFGWNGSTSNLPAAYLTGLLAGKRALETKVESAVFDIGIKVPAKGSKIFATLKGIVDSGVNVPHGEEILPVEDRIKGLHINEAIPPQFEAVKAKIMAGGQNKSQSTKESKE